MSELQLKKLKPQRFIPGIAIAWGVSSLCTGFVQNKTQMIVIRLLLYVHKHTAQLSLPGFGRSLDLDVQAWAIADRTN